MVSFPVIMNSPLLADGVILVETKRMEGYFFYIKITAFTQMVIAHIITRIHRSGIDAYIKILHYPGGQDQT